MKFKYLYLLLAFYAVMPAAWGQTQGKLKSQGDTDIMLPHLAKESVRSLHGVPGNVLDTIDTQTPGVQIILYENKTWKYYRDPSVAQKADVFKEHWDTDAIDPYHQELSSLPERISIWIADTLNEYHCPRQVKVYSKFGLRHRRRHQGVDLPLHRGDPVGAAFSGRVRVSKYYKGYGNLVIVRHENGLETFYAHLSERSVTAGEWVDAGDRIGLGGSTGRSTGPHLHFETRYRGYAFDPEWLIDFESGELRHRLFVLKKKHLSIASKYVPESEDEEDEIHAQDSASYDAAAKAAAEAAAAKYHKIKSGDTLGRIARKYGTTVSAICRLNKGLTATSTLKIGRSIRVK